MVMLGHLLDPFSEEARRIVQGAPPIEDLPEGVFRLTREKLLWMQREKRPPRSLLAAEGREDVLSFHLLYQAGGLFPPHSGEVRLVREVTHQILKFRLMDLGAQMDPLRILGLLENRFSVEEMVDEGETYRLGDLVVEKREVYGESLGRFRGEKGVVGEGSYRLSLQGGEMKVRKYGIRWKSLLPLLRNREIQLTDWLIRGGYLLLSLTDLLDLYARMVAVEAQEYMAGIYEKTRSRGIQVHPRVQEIGTLLSTVSRSLTRTSLLTLPPSKLHPEFFPPCIRLILNGVSSGSRNYAISVLLTSFLSYARIAPPKTENPRISDHLQDPAVITEEILPLIEKGAERCHPPLFEDQPLERLNVFYHLGFGLTREVRLEKSGTSKWYFPPNCEKIQRESPPLCQPDAFCRRIKNPLNYYFLKRRGEKDPSTPEKRTGGKKETER
jgi:DNA primase large subunit